MNAKLKATETEVNKQMSTAREIVDLHGKESGLRLESISARDQLDRERLLVVLRGEHLRVPEILGEIIVSPLRAQRARTVARRSGSPLARSMGKPMLRVLAYDEEVMRPIRKAMKAKRRR